MSKRWLLKAVLLMTVLSLVLSSCMVRPEENTQVAPTDAPAQPAEPTATEAAAEPTATEAASGEATPTTGGEATAAPTEATGSGEWRNTDPYSAYPETVTLRLVKGGQENASLLPEGESIEDNRALQYIEDTLNVDITFDWVVPSDSYEDRLNLTITSGEYPDAMIVTPIQLQQLVEAGALEDLTPYIDQYANADILANYEATEGVAIDAATIDGKVWGVPNVQPQADAPLMVWVRKDWLDKLNLEGPETIEDVEALARAFIEQDPDGNGTADTVGLTGTKQPVFVPSNLHGFDIIFNAYGAFPTLFHEKDGQIVYGSVQPEAKEALATLARWYQEGLIDPDFATKDTDASNQLPVGGQSGIMIGPWWISWWPLNESIANNPDADWQPYIIKDNNGEYSFSMGAYTNSFVVVRKGYEHPEVVLKILNIQNDLSYGLNDAPQYYPNFNEIWNVLFPIPFLIEQPYVVENMAKQYQGALDGTEDPTTFGSAMQIEFDQIQKDMAAPRSDSANWATRMARLDAASLLANAEVNEVRSDPKAVRFYTVDPNWPSLKKMEEEAFLQIITGAQPLEYFDEFVQQWNEQGGTDLLAKMNQ